MKDYIINSFILRETNTIDDIYNYIKLWNIDVENKIIKLKLSKYIRKNIIILNNKTYKLTQEGNVILTDNKYYYSKIIFNFLRKYKNKKYVLKEIRKEQQLLRNFLITNKPNICIICDKLLPLCLLETAHLKPRCILNHAEKYDKNIVEFMCSYCHNLYDNGFLSVKEGLLQVSSNIDNYDLTYNKNKQIIHYNLYNKKYFIFHYNNIYNH
jgi:hypothetical protein